MDNDTKIKRCSWCDQVLSEDPDTVDEYGSDLEEIYFCVGCEVWLRDEMEFDEKWHNAQLF
jgi:hypothetical protein